MKKITKILAVLLSLIFCLSAFAVVSSAAVTLNNKTTKDNALKYHDERLAAISKANNIVKTTNEYSLYSKADVSKLSALDARLTADRDNYEESGVSEFFVHGDSEKEYFEDGKSEFFNYFSISKSVKEWHLKYRSYKYAEDKNGNKTLTFVYFEESVDGETVCTYTVQYDKSGNLLSYRLRQESDYSTYSVQGQVISVEEVIDDYYTFTYKKTAVTGITLSETDVTVRLGKEYVVTPTVNPSNATFKDIDIGEYDFSVVSCYVNDNGEIVIVGENKGTTEIEIITCDGNKKAVITVTVEATFFDLLLQFFRNLFTWFLYI